MNRIVLASNSPRRKELLEQANVNFIIDSKTIEEVFDQTLPLQEQMQQVAYQKAKALENDYPNDFIIGADTMILYNNLIKIGKPKDRADAKKTLSLLSNTVHQVLTGVTILYCGKKKSFCESTTITFKELTEQNIEEYLNSNEWMDKAGSYAIQGIAKEFVLSIDGDINNVIGLPVSKLLATIREF